MKRLALVLLVGLQLRGGLQAAEVEWFCSMPELDKATAARVEAVLRRSKRDQIRPPGGPDVPSGGGTGEMPGPRPVPAFQEIRVAVHVITDGEEGRISRQVLDVLMENLNRAYHQTPYRFRLVHVDWTDNAGWFRGCGWESENERAMKARLAVDPEQTLNLYTCAPEGGRSPKGTVGYGYLPWMQPDTPYLHGVVIHPRALPVENPLARRHRGMTVAHEIGHYLGLIHTFDGGCGDAEGDLVDDTPTQAGPTGQCAVRHDSCPNVSGFDDVRNFMNYTDDDCMDHFTPGQIERMKDVVEAFRPGLVGGD